mgnify:CR=1 FL=1
MYGNPKKHKIKNLVNDLKFKKFFENKNFLILYRGNIYEEKNLTILKIIDHYKKKKFNDIADNINGNYLIYFYDKINNIFFLSNSQTSFHNLFYKKTEKDLYLSIQIKYFLKKKNEINQYKLFEWLISAGRSFTNETAILNVYYLLPGETLIVKDRKVEIIQKKYLSYKDKKISIKSLKKSLKKAIELRTKNIKDSIMLGLTGGLDSRIISGLVNNKKIISYTYGNLNNFEKIISSFISNMCSLKKHENINIDEKEYFPKKLMNAYIDKGNFNSTFQHEYQYALFNKIAKKNNTQYFMLGCALDQFLGSTFSGPELLSLKDKKQYFDWFKKKFFLFNNKELSLIFGKKTQKYQKIFKENFFRIVKNFKYKNFVDLNDALHFEVRILRWYNRNLNFINQNDRRILSPTYDKVFLKYSFQTNYKKRLKDFYRKNLLKEISDKLYRTPTLSSFTPPLISDNLSNKFELSLNNLENLNSKDKTITKIPSLMYDVNIARMINHSSSFKKFKNLIEKKFIKLPGSKKQFSFLNKLTFKQENQATISDIKKIIFLISLYNIIVIINEKN